MANRSGSSGGKGEGGAGSGFDRDFGYLLPFLDKVTAVASTLPDAAARAELQRLMAEEKVRWARARELLSGVPGRAGAAAAPAAAPPRARPGDPRPQQPGAQLTVGSLKPSR
jgi:hypothetical protein